LFREWRLYIKNGYGRDEARVAERFADNENTTLPVQCTKGVWTLSYLCDFLNARWRGYNYNKRKAYF
jgi:hypothetical protein